jgi:predicted ArsR family transcriptional regulator
MQTTRQRIIDHLKGKHLASAAEIGGALGVTPADVRHHLGILLAEGAVQESSQRRGGGRGRPTKLYTLSGLVQQHNLDGLSDALIAEFISPLAEEQRQAALQSVARRLSGTSQPQPGHLTRRLYACVQRLNEMGYQARWEAHAAGPHIVFEHCPYALILAEHPELCQLDAHLLAALLAAPVAQTARLAPDQRGGRHCTFVASPATVSRLSEG